MQDKNPLAHYSGVLSEAVQESAGVPNQAQIKALMRKHCIWIEHSTLFEDDLPARELRAVQAEQHQFEAFVQDLIALSAAKTTPESDYLEGVSIPNLREALIFLGRENGVGEGEVGDKLAQYVNSVVSGVLSKKAALREAPQAAPAAVAGPDGWKLVPVDLTPEMKREFMDLLMDGIDIYVNRRDQIEIQTDAPRRIWKAVLALAPSAPADALATATGLPAQAVLDYPWRDRLLDGRELVRDQQGFAEHSELPLLDEGMKPRAFFAALGVEMKHTMADDDLSMDEYDAMSDAENWSAWMPRPPIGDAWNLVAIFDTEDGPAAWWMRELRASQEGVAA
ncbi:hypothetical protein CTTA_4973 [Comamonas testosteroni]|uniref:Uncharacterized protein n=1 Tax=Comamonas testosteroni TaxID=285 RepID=A0A5A7MJH1_COMTE|nr:hypothetical protein [Comamonas testosteroni]GEQ77968.1 hypothetical protein CTTA_4973 [Comamonas testosteroni]